MSFIKKILVISSFICHVYGMPMMGGGIGGGMEMGGMHMPKPYSFDYMAPNYMGTHYRDESGDGSGMVRGSYGYQDAQGLYRTVNYVAGPGMGFQAEVQTNEPGTIGHQKEQPSHVMMQAQHPPPGVQTHFGSGIQTMKMMEGMKAMKMMEGMKAMKMMGGGMMGGGMVGGGMMGEEVMGGGMMGGGMMGGGKMGGGIKGGRMMGGKMN